MRCYNLVFNLKIFCKNYGSIITLIFFIIYVIFMIYYCCKDITPLKIALSKIIFDTQKNDNSSIKQNLFLNQYDPYNTRTSKTIRNLKTNTSRTKKGNFPPKRDKAKKIRNDSFEGNLGQTDNMKLIEIVKKKRNSKRLKKVNLNDKDKESVNSEKHRKRKTIVDYVNEQKKIKINKNNNNDIEIFKM